MQEEDVKTPEPDSDALNEAAQTNTKPDDANGCLRPPMPDDHESVDEAEPGAESEGKSSSCSTPTLLENFIRPQVGAVRPEFDLGSFDFRC